ncbi:MAG: RHS repeat-associated core domain-containing protein [Lachnospiraceae bacterium]|nr:RHS repeat-associated core domain-containing protein [Lachnospiraceae bacterium]
MANFVYDCRNRLIQAGDTKYTYDPENNRRGVETNEKKIDYAINTQPELSQVLQSTEIKGNKETATVYFYGNGLNSQDNGNDYLTYHFNNVGSTMAVTDAKGSVVETYNYTPYGELIDGEYRQDIPFLYNGQYGVTTDSNGLYYMRARYYNVDIKRFINQDVLLGVLERVSSLNRYAYVEGNPVSYLDPFGLDRVDTSDVHEFLLYMSIGGTITTMIFPPLGYPLAAAVNALDLWVTCFDLGQDTVTGNYEDSIEDLLYILCDILGLLTAVSLLAIETGEASKIIVESEKELKNIGDLATISSYYTVAIDKCKKLINKYGR